MKITAFEELLAFLQRYIAFYQEFLNMETEKYVSLTKGRLEQLDEFVKQEQAYMLRSRGMEQERETLMAAANCAEMPFKQLLEAVPRELTLDFRRAYDDLNEVFSDLRAVNGESTLITQARLRSIEEAAAKVELRPGDYNHEAKKERQRPATITQKV